MTLQSAELDEVPMACRNYVKIVIVALSNSMRPARRSIVAKMDRAYEDLLSDRITDEFWTRRSAQWEAEVATIDRELSRTAR